MASDQPHKSSLDPAPIDFSLLHGIEVDVADGDPEIMLELIDIFLNDTQEHFTGMHKALAEDGYRQIEISVHSLKSSAATFGAMPLSAYCARLEQLIRSRQMAEIRTLLPIAEAEFSRVEELLLVERKRWL